MLTSLSIKNFAIIDQLEIRFSSGFSVVTGETGAGKSIIMGALGLVLGQRADGKIIKNDSEKCLIEACFDISEYGMKTFFDENDLDYDTSCIFRREILPGGKSRAFVNDTPASLSLLKELGEQLIDIHSQHENLLLKDNSFQLKVVDTIAQNEVLRKEYKLAYSQLRKLKTDLQLLIEQSQKDAADKEYIQFQVEQLQTAALKETEQEELEHELKQLTHAEEIKTELSKIFILLTEDNQGVLSALKEAHAAAKRSAKFLEEASELEERLNSCLLELKDLSAEVDQKQAKIEYDPQRIELIAQRLDMIYSLQQKHRVQTVAELLVLQEDLEQKLSAIANSDEQIKLLENQIKAAEDKAAALATKLTQTRTKAADVIAKQIVSKLELLGMPKVAFEVRVSDRQELSTQGRDQIEFLFSANDKIKLQPVTQIASGGEIARVMLSVKSLIANTKALPTIIFDEIDTGISGEIADKMASIMKEMSANMQVLTITHLPQIASKGNFHFRVFKDNLGTQIKNLSTEERVVEIAQMLSGSALTEAAVANAKALLNC